ncbi:SDR family oxidoreductase [Amaricoccus sp.]|uniref:SDR family NAD(P)-dependent oxidoreductase n=1 Tax=Amaricoccus sp. TaxID=1872485 RepID=UPI00261CBBE4|nr:SDR family oxidoreductase [uncultured Amaricoccus sp.]
MGDGLAGKSVIVTGAARGVGRAAARGFVRAGASVMMADIDETRLEREVETIAREGHDGRAVAFTGDLRQKLTMSNLVAATLDAFDNVHVLVNASRLMVAADPFLPDTDQFDAMLERNVTAPLRLSQVVARRMMEFAAAEKPRPVDRAIVNIGSIQSKRTLPELLGYSVSCAALDQMTRAFAVALAGHGVRVNGVAVGGMLSGSMESALGEIEDLAGALGEVVPLGRLGEPEEAAAAVIYLASPAASFVTGQILAVDGGRLLLDPLDTPAA